jgi:hypothetical protein
VTQNTDCDNGITALVLTEDMRIFKLEFYRTSKKAGRQLLSYARQSPSIWFKWYSLSTVAQKNDKGEFFIFKVNATGQETPAHIREASAALYTMIGLERKAFLQHHYDAQIGSQTRASTIDESPDFIPGSTAPSDPSNPDLSGAGL